MGVEDVGAHYTIYFSLCVQISGGEKALKKMRGSHFCERESHRIQSKQDRPAGEK